MLLWINYEHQKYYGFLCQMKDNNDNDDDDNDNDDNDDDNDNNSDNMVDNVGSVTEDNELFNIEFNFRTSIIERIRGHVNSRTLQV